MLTELFESVKRNYAITAEYFSNNKSKQLSLGVDHKILDIASSSKKD